MRNPVRRWMDEADLGPEEVAAKILEVTGRKFSAGGIRNVASGFRGCGPDLGEALAAVSLGRLKCVREHVYFDEAAPAPALSTDAPAVKPPEDATP